MPIHPQTGITYGEGSANSRFVVCQNGDYQNPTAYGVQWGRYDGGPFIGGFPAGEEWFRMQQATLPEYDARYVVTDTYGPVHAPDPVLSGYPSGTWEPTRTAVLRSAAELIAEIEATRTRINNALYPSAADPAHAQTISAIKEKLASVGQINATEQRILAEHEAVQVAVQANYTHAYQLIDAATAGEPYDMRSGWQLPPTWDTIDGPAT